MISRYLEHVLFESEVDWVMRYVLEAITRGSSLGKKLVEVGICIAAGLKRGQYERACACSLDRA